MTRTERTHDASTMAPGVRRHTVFRRPGRFAGWPANYGMWAWGHEVLAMFVVGHVGPINSIHARDVTRAFVPILARSLDGGDTWTFEEFTGRIPGGARTLSGDEHVAPELKVGPRLRDHDFVDLDAEIDFRDPETLVLCARTDLESGSASWFYVSRDRGHTWRGPHHLPDFGFAGVSARTDVVALDTHRALFLLSGTKSDGTEGRAFAARTEDGGRTFEFCSFIGPEPAGWSIMPSSIRLAGGVIVTALRCCDPDRGGSAGEAGHRIDLYASVDGGRTWTLRATPVAATGRAGNPPAMVRTASGRLVIHYGYRDAPRGLRAVVSDDDGATWSDPITLTADTATLDMGYPRAVAMDDGQVLAIFYSNAGDDSERFIESVRWDPDAV